MTRRSLNLHKLPKNRQVALSFRRILIILERLKQDLLDARDNGVTWKFVMLPEAIQNFGPVIEAGDTINGGAGRSWDKMKKGPQKGALKYS